MKNLVIGESISTLHDTHTIYDLYQGLVYFDDNEVNSIVVNVADEILTKIDILAIINLVKVKKIPAIIISDIKDFNVFQKIDYITVISKDAGSEYIFNRHVEALDYKSLFNQISIISKQRRTIPFYVLGTLLLIEPLIKILFFKFDTGFDFQTVFDTIFSIKNPVKVVEFWLLFPVAGLALFRSSAYSLFVFAGVYLYSMYAYFSYEKFSWPYVQETPHFSANLILFFNTALLIYFLIPENLKPFSNKTLFAFKRPERMSTMFETVFKFNNKNLAATVINISDSGVMISLKNELIGSGYMELIVGSQALSCQLIREVDSAKDGIHNYGLKFNFRDKDEKSYLKDYISSINLKGSSLVA